MYFNSLKQRLNQVIQQAAAANNSTFVDTFSSSVGHDACKLPRRVGQWDRSELDRVPLHPNQMGEQNMANRMLAALGR